MPTNVEGVIAQIESIYDRWEIRAQSRLLLAQEAVGRITALETENPPRPEVFIYHDGSYALVIWPDQEIRTAAAGDYPVIDAIVRACSELSRACPCPLIVCPEAHHECHACGAVRTSSAAPPPLSCDAPGALTSGTVVLTRHTTIPNRTKRPRAEPNIRIFSRQRLYSFPRFSRPDLPSLMTTAPPSAKTPRPKIQMQADRFSNTAAASVRQPRSASQD